MTRARTLLPLLAAAAVAAVTWAAYAQVVGFDFVGFDDDDYVRANHAVLGGLSAEGLRWAWTSGEASNWHPLTWLSHMADVELFGLDAGAHHRTNLVLHVLNALLLLGAVRAATGSLAAATGTAALFALHPLHVESVAWVAERKDVLSTGFGFGAVWAYAAWARRGGAPRYALVAFLLAASLCAKATFVTLPFALLLLDAWPLGRLRGGPAPAAGAPACGARSAGRLVLEKLPLLALSVAAAVVTFLVQDAGGATSTGLVLPLGARLENAVVAWALYLAKTVAPVGLAMFYPHPSLNGGPGWGGAAVAGAAALLLALTAGAWVQRRRRPWLLVGWLWYLGTLVPMLGVVQVGAQSMADRYTYVPLVGVFLALAWSLVELGRARPRLRPALAAVAVLVLGACAVRTRAQAATWRDGEALARHALAVTDGNWNAHTLLADVLRERGETEAAVEQYRRALEAGPETSVALNNLGLCRFEQGRVPEALELYRRALAIDPGYVQAHSNRGRALSASGRLEAAIAAYREALRLDPAFLDAHNNLGADLARAGRLDEALPHLEAVLRLNPTARQALSANVNLGLCYANRMEAALARGDRQAAGADRRRAAEHFRAARAVDGTNPLPLQLLRQLGYDS